MTATGKAGSLQRQALRRWAQTRTSRSPRQHLRHVTGSYRICVPTCGRPSLRGRRRLDHLTVGTMARPCRGCSDVRVRHLLEGLRSSLLPGVLFALGNAIQQRWTLHVYCHVHQCAVLVEGGRENCVSLRSCLLAAGFPVSHDNSILYWFGVQCSVVISVVVGRD